MADDSGGGLGYLRVVPVPPDHSESTDPVVLLLGPTAGGKTSLSIALARTLPNGGECVVADSMQIYRGMVIGTAQPTPAERAGVPHHLCGVVDPRGAAFTVRDWLAAAEASVVTIRDAGRMPILVGGTNLYARAFLEGVFDGPGRDEAVRATLEARNTAALRTRLVEVDPVAAERIHPNDRRRTIRALEVYEVTGTPISDQQSQWGSAIEGRAAVRVVVLDWPAEVLNRRINARVRRMMETGFLDEVRRLQDEGELGKQACEAVGYRELRDHLAGRLGLEEAVEHIKIRTRRYGKQQRTWLRRFLAVPGAIRLDPVDRTPDSLADELMGHLAARGDC